MKRRRKKDEVIQHGPRQKEVQHFVKLLLWYVIVYFLFWAVLLNGPGLLGGYLLTAIVFSLPFRTIDWRWWHWGTIILATVLVVPLHYLRKNIERRLDEARYQLEQIGLPESPEDTDTSHTT